RCTTASPRNPGTSVPACGSACPSSGSAYRRTNPMRLAVDVMGGDHAPDAILKGCIEALPLLAPTDQLVLVGNARDIDEILSERSISDPRIIVEPASEVIGMD